MKAFLKATLAIALLVGVSTQAQAGVITIPDSALIPSTTYYTDQIGGGIGPISVTTGGGNANGAGDPSGRNDDGFNGPINLGFTLTFFGQQYTQFFINNNGNISFNEGISAYTPAGPQGATEPIISPFFGDVDTRNTASGVVHVRTDIPNEVIVTWDQVGYFFAHADKLDSFQLVLRGPGYNIPTGEGAIGFFYKSMQWETGDASGGSGGFGGTPAAVGFGDGQNNGEVLQGSIENGISGIVNDTHIWFDTNLNVVPPTPSTAPEPTSLTLAGIGLASLLGYGWRRRRQAANNPVAE
jgi:MYXO-CTERM domain-containing protein